MKSNNEEFQGDFITLSSYSVKLQEIFVNRSVKQMPWGKNLTDKNFYKYLLILLQNFVLNIINLQHKKLKPGDHWERNRDQNWKHYYMQGVSWHLVCHMHFQTSFFTKECSKVEQVKRKMKRFPKGRSGCAGNPRRKIFITL